MAHQIAIDENDDVRPGCRKTSGEGETQGRRAVKRGGRILFFWMLPAFLLGVIEVKAQDPRQAEYELKAAFLYKFASFVAWPTNGLPNSNGEIVLGILGDDRFGETLEQTIDPNSVPGHKLVIRRLKDTSGVKDCQILFISASERRHLPQIFESLNGTSVLTVGETDEFCQLGGIINFKKVNKNIRFEINPAAAERAHLKISSQLLKLAILVKEEGKERRN